MKAIQYPVTALVHNKIFVETFLSFIWFCPVILAVMLTCDYHRLYSSSISKSMISPAKCSVHFFGAEKLLLEHHKRPLLDLFPLKFLIGPLLELVPRKCPGRFLLKLCASWRQLHEIQIKLLLLRICQVGCQKREVLKLPITSYPKAQCPRYQNKILNMLKSEDDNRLFWYQFVKENTRL